MSNENYEGFNELSKSLSDLLNNMDDGVDILEIGAKSFTDDLLKLGKPISQIRKNSYTHLIDTFSYEKKNDEVIVGWGKYYGRMVENGTKNMSARPHMYPLFEKNKEKYYKLMLAKLSF